MKFYHTSDIHLGAVPDGCFPWSKARGEEIYDSFVRLVDQAELEKIDLLLISGDLFHRQPLSRELQVLGELFGSLKKTQVVFITGNRESKGEKILTIWKPEGYCISSIQILIDHRGKSADMGNAVSITVL